MNKVFGKYKNVIGWSGSVILVLNYLFLSVSFFNSRDLLFNFFQFFGGLLLGVRVYLDKNYSNLFLEIFFCLVAVYSMLKIFIL